MTHDEMERIAGVHDSKAAKIRALYDAGVTVSEISTFLKVRYQHSYNVLKRAKLVGRDAAASQEQQTGTMLSVEVGADGTFTLPGPVRDALDLASGGTLYLKQTPQGVLLVPRELAIAELQRLAALHMPEHADMLTALLQSIRPEPG